MEKFQKTILDYIDKSWVNGPLDPRIWCVFYRHEDLTNNNSESHNSWFMNLLGEKHANPHFVLRAVVKALTMAETTYREWKSSTSKPLNNKYKKLSDKREECKKKVQRSP